MPTDDRATQPLTKGKLVLIDAYSLLYRAYHALPELRTRDGQATQALYGFALMLLRLLEEEKPDFLAVVTDRPGATFRDELYADYKANRPPMPEDLASQIPLVYELVEAFRIPVLGLEGYEADDCLGTVAEKAREQGLFTLIVTGDKDTLQLVKPGIEVILTRRGIKDTERLDVEGVREKLGVPPERVADLKGLTGDPSDNIPGVPGIGPKTAVKWLNEYGSLEAVLEHASEIRGKAGENLRQFAQQARLSKRLATINTQAPLEVEWDDLRRREPAWELLVPFLMRWEFGSLLKRLHARHPGAVERAGFKPETAGAEPPGVSAQAGATENGQAPATAASPAPALDGSRVASPVGTGHPNPLPQLISPADMPRWLQRWKSSDSLAITLLTSGEHPLKTRAVALAVAVHGGVGVLPLPQDAGPEQNAAIRRALEHIFANPEIEKLLFDVKQAIHALRPWGVALVPPFHDAMLAAYLLNPGSGTPQLEDVLKEALGENFPAPQEVLALAEAAGWVEPPTGQRRLVSRGAHDAHSPFASAEEAVTAMARLADGLRRSWPTLWERMRHDELLRVYEEIEVQLAPVLADMEYAGIRVDGDYLRAMSAEMDRRLIEMTHEIHRLAGEVFNLNSPRQLAVILYEKLGLPVLKRTKTGPSTDAEVLEELAAQHELPAALLGYRQLAKLKSTYVDALPALACPSTGRVHTHFNQAVTATGRLSSTNPNLQNIPVRTEEGRMIRAAFIPESDDRVLLTADYSQIELRVLAHLSEDPSFVEAFHRGEDIHARTAAEVFEVPLEEVTPQQRAAAKAINFGIIYGISSFGLAKGTGLSRQEAQAYIDGYFQRYPGVKSYLDRTVASAREKGYVTTLFGRRRYLPDLKSRNRVRRQFAERTAMNTPIQGSAADIIKRSMIQLSRRLKELGLEARLLLQVHDELVLECPRSHVVTVGRIVKEAMENAAQLKVPLVVELKAGPNWKDTEPLRLDAS